MKFSMTKLFPALMTGLVGALSCTGALAEKWIRSEVVTCYNMSGQNITLLTVPPTATRPYYLRQSFAQSGAGSALNGAYLYANDKAVAPIFSGAQTALVIPFKAGELVSVRCGMETVTMSFVFSYL